MTLEAFEPRGWLFIGHSESLIDVCDSVEMAAQRLDALSRIEVAKRGTGTA